MNPNPAARKPMSVAAAPRKGWNINWINFGVDIVILIAFFIAYNEHLTGGSVHEWFSLALGLMLLVHLLLHWRWVVNVTAKLLSKLPAMTRIGYVLNVLLLLDFGAILYSGLKMSREVVPALGGSASEGRTWHGLHGMTANVAILLVLLHIAVHWKWIVDMVRRRAMPGVRASMVGSESSFK